MHFTLQSLSMKNRTKFEIPYIQAKKEKEKKKNNKF